MIICIKEQHSTTSLHFSDKIQLYKAHPIRHFTKIEDRYCTKEYVGTKFVYYDTQIGCAYPASDLDAAKDTFPVGKCSRGSRKFGGRFWTIGTCRYTEERAIELEKITVEYETDETIVWCYMRKIKIGDEKYACPDYVFRLDEDIEFSINGIAYKNPLTISNYSTNSINMALAPPETVDIEESMDKNNTIGSNIEIIAYISFLIISLVISIAAYFLRY